MNESTIIGWCHAGKNEGKFTTSLLRLVFTDSDRGKYRRIKDFIAIESSPRIAAARNSIVAKFLESDAQWLLMVDDDMVFEPTALNELFRAAHPQNAPIVGGLCFGGGRSDAIYPTLYILKPQEQEGEDPVQIIRDYPENALVKVDATGAAFLLMHRTALEKIGAEFAGPYPWFAEGTVYKGYSFGEDWAFCMRAKQLDIPVHVHTGCEIGHVKSRVLDAEAWKDHRRKVGA